MYLNKYIVKQLKEIVQKHYIHHSSTYCMFPGSGRKPEKPLETNTDIRRTCTETL